jgi:hypothetical protein
MTTVIPRAPFPFPDGRFPPELGAVVHRRVANGEQPALLVIHDDENDWLIGDGTSDPDDSVIVHISHVVALDTTVGTTASLPRGHVARRSSVSAPWVIEEWRYPDEE